MTISVSRRAALLGGLALPFAASASLAEERWPMRLRTIPTRIYRSISNARENLDGWVLFLVLEVDDARPLTPVGLRLTYLAGTQPVREDRIFGASLASIARQDIPPARLTGLAPDPPVYWPHAFRIHCYVFRTPAVSELVFELQVAETSAREHRLELRVPVMDFVQRTALVFPFRGKGLISQAGVLSGGHRNRSGAFAVDALGLDANYAPMSGPASGRPQDYSGWGRPIIAPAAGIVVAARHDRPDQPRDGESDPAFYAREYPGGGDVGNHVVIDHGNGEFSMIAHMRMGSVRVARGDRLSQGQQLGELGNSGDTSGPHVHFQLQDGPRWEYADGLPMHFSNVESLARGAYFDAH